MTDDAWVGRTLAGRYRLTSPLGAGGMGAVYRAIQEPLGREVAVKVLKASFDADAQARERFEREARALAKLSHANVVVLHDFGSTDDGALYLVMEEVNGRTLRDVMQSRGGLPWPRAARLAVQIARGLRAAHTAGVIHADLKPENVVVHRPAKESEQIKLLDFGLARLRHGGDATVTQAGMIVGTPRYLSPERIQGVRDDERSDLYALGVMLYEMLAGAAPFEAPAAAMLLVLHMTQPASAPSAAGVDVPADLDGLVLDLLAKAPDARPADADTVVRRLEAIIGAGPSTEAFAMPPTEPEGAVDASAALASWPPVQSDAPTGRVTLVFTDIEGSSTLWDAAPTTMREALAVHDEVMRRTLAARSGYEVKTQGDSFMVTFDSPLSAACWCLDVQDELLKGPWPDALLALPGCEPVSRDGELLFKGLRVRMGVFEGEPECRPDPLTGRMDYFGPVVNRAARVESAAHGGQVLLGGHLAHAATSLLGAVPADLTDLGQHRLKGIEGTERLVEVRSKHLSGRRFAAPRTLSEEVPRTNLVPDEDAFIGRDEDLVRVAEAVSDATLVTLLGPGGTGKTRLSRRLGAQHVGDYAGGVWFVDLTTATTPVGVATALADAIGLEQLGGETMADSVELLGHNLAERGATLLVLDNFEQVAEHAAVTVGAWRKLAPQARFLVTSRVPLQLEGERELELRPFDATDGVALFLTRCPRTLESEDDLAAVRDIVVALDGLPLAIELAAARGRVLGPKQILDRLGKRLDFLKTSNRERTSRQTNLRGAIDWSWDLLDETERSAFAQCGAFAGGFALEAAEAVLDVGDADVLDVVQSLKEKSLLLAQPTDEGELRLSMYESIRAYAAERLEDRPEREDVVLRHATFFVDGGEAAVKKTFAGGMVDGVAWLSDERENLFAAAHRLEGTTPALAARALLALERLLAIRGPYQGRFDVLQRALRAVERADDDLVEAKARLALGRFYALEGDALKARHHLELVIPLAEKLGDDDLFIAAVAFLTRAAQRRGQAVETEELRARAQGHLERAGPSSRALFAAALGLVAFGTADVGGAVRHGREALAFARQAGNRGLEGRVLGNLGVNSMVRGDPAGAADLYRRALEIHTSNGDRPMQAMIIGNLGAAHLALGELDLAQRELEQAIAIHREVGNALLLHADSMMLAMLLFTRGDAQQSRELVESALGFYETREGALREKVTAMCCLLYFAADRGDIETVRQMRAGLRENAARATALLYFLGDAMSLVDGRALLAEAAVADAERAAQLQQEALEHFLGAAATVVNFLQPFVQWFERALRDAGLKVPDALQRAQAKSA
jgi:predicted ATPase/class 3 adenylate cyclase